MNDQSFAVRRGSVETHDVLWLKKSLEYVVGPKEPMVPMTEQTFAVRRGSLETHGVYERTDLSRAS